MSTDTQAAQSIAAAIERLPDGSAYWRRIRARLARLARRAPFKFWPQYLDAINPPDPDAMADVREMLAENPNAVINLVTVREFLERRKAVEQ